MAAALDPTTQIAIDGGSAGPLPDRESIMPRDARISNNRSSWHPIPAVTAGLFAGLATADGMPSLVVAGAMADVDIRQYATISSR